MHEEPVDLVLLQTFYEVAQAGTVTAAAKKLGRSQPAVSHRLKNLERDLGVPLFEKIGRRLVLTEAGERLRIECQDLMARSRGIHDRVAGIDGELVGSVSIGTLPTVAAHLLVEPLRSLFVDHPGVSVRFEFAYVSELCRRLRVGELDVIVVVGPVDEVGLELEEIGVVHIVAVMAPEMAPRATGSVTPYELAEYRYLAFGGERDPTFDTIDKYASEQGLEGPHTPNVPHIETLRELVAAGAGYALVPEYTTRRDCAAGRLIALQPEGLDIALPVAIGGRRGQAQSIALETVRRALARVHFDPRC